MRKTVLFALLPVLFSAVAPGNAQGKRYYIQSGVIEYTVSGAQTGTEVLYFDRWGMREAKYTNTEIKMMGMSQKQNKLTITEDEWITTIDLDRRTGTKMRNTVVKEMLEKSGSKDLAELGENMMKAMKAVKVGSANVAGKTCDVWEIKDLGSTNCVWNWIPLKTQVKMAGVEIVMVAAKVQEGGPVPDSKFAVPAGVKISEGRDPTDVLRELQGKMKGQN